MMIKKIGAVVALGFGLVCAGQASESFVKYKKYIIPIGNSCPEYTSDLPRVLYFDDVGVIPEDPNGVQELPVIAGLHNYKINLVAMGTRSSDSGSYDLFEKVMSRSVHYKSIPLLNKDDISDRIVAEAKCIPSGDFLHVALGAEFNELADALDTDPSIAEKIKAYGIHTSNVSSSSSKLIPYNTVKGFLGSNLRMVDFYNSESNQWASSTQKFSGTNVRQLLHVFYPRGNITEDSLNNILFNHINVRLGGITDSSGVSITSRNGDYLQLVNSWAPNHVSANDDLYLRVADILTVANVFMSIDDTYNTEKMHNLIKEATSRF